MLHADLFRTGWHRAIDTFGIIDGPIAETITTTTADIRWVLNEVASGQVEYGTTDAYGSTTSEEPASSGYSEHIQTITGLTQGQAYHYRVKSTSGAGVTVYSSDRTFTAEGAPVASGRDTRAAPAVPTGDNVFTIPGTIADDGTGDVGGAINAWLDELPDGATAVFTSTDTEGYEHGVDSPVATYRMVTGLNVTGNDITLWGYGVKFKLDGSGSDYYAGGVRFWRNGTITVRGFEMEGTHFDAGTPAGHDTGRQYLHGVGLQFDSGGTVLDCWVHHVHGDGVSISSRSPLQNYAPGPVELAYNRFELLGRNGVTLNQNDVGTVWIHHSYMGDTGLYNIDGEDNRHSSSELLDVLIEECDFGTFTWGLFGWRPRSISFVFSYGSEPQPHIAECGPVTIRNCSFAGTAPHVFAAKGGDVGIIDQHGVLEADGDYHDFTVTDCDFTNVPSDQRSVIYWAKMPNIRNVTLTDNTGLGALASRYQTSESTGTVTVSGNT